MEIPCLPVCIPMLICWRTDACALKKKTLLCEGYTLTALYLSGLRNGWALNNKGRGSTPAVANSRCAALGLVLP